MSTPDFKTILFFVILFLTFLLLPIIRGCNSAVDEMEVKTRAYQLQKEKEDDEFRRNSVRLYKSSIGHGEYSTKHHDEKWHEESRAARTRSRRNRMAERSKSSALTDEQQELVQDMIEEETSWDEAE